MTQAVAQDALVTVTDVLMWLNGRAGGKMTEQGARTRKHAVMTLLGELPPTTSIDDVHLDVQATRWLAGNKDRQNATAQSYKSRCAAAFREYRAWQADPDSFRQKARTTRPRVPAHRRDIDVRELRFVPLSDGAEIAFLLPKRPLAMLDVARITQHLETLAHDWGKS